MSRRADGLLNHNYPGEDKGPQVAIVDPQIADLTIASLAARGMKAWVAGQIEPALSVNMPGSALLAGKYQSR